MPNSPNPETVTVSFTLPRELAAAVSRAARSKMTNKSDVIRQALMQYLPESERSAVMEAIQAAQVAPVEKPASPVSYSGTKKKGKAKE